MKHILYDVGKVLLAGLVFLLVYFMCRCIPRCFKAFWGLFHLILYPQNLKLYLPLPTMNSYSFLRRNEVLRGKKKNLTLNHVSKPAGLKKRITNFTYFRTFLGCLEGWDNVRSLAGFFFGWQPLAAQIGTHRADMQRGNIWRFIKKSMADMADLQNM